MEEAKEIQLSITDHEQDYYCDEANSNGHSHTNTSTTITNQTPSTNNNPKTLKRWVCIAVFSVLVVADQAAATLLSRLYFEKGGNCNWLVTLVQLAGFPILLPYYTMTRISSNNKSPKNATTTKEAYSKWVVASVYIVLGLLTAFNSYLYSVGLMHIPVSTFSLICASQLAFNAFFSYFLNKQRFTPYIVNSLVLLSVSSVLLVFNSGSDGDSAGTKVSRGKYAAGFVCTVAASAGYGLVLSLTQYFVANVLRRPDDLRVIVDVTLWQSAVASLATVVGLFASGEWARIGAEMDSFRLGRVSYVMVLTWTGVMWQLFMIGNVGFVVAVSSLFANVVSALGLPVVPVLAVFVFGEKMSGVKAVALVLAIWGFVSYVYQSYLDTQATKKLERQEIASDQ